MALAKTGTAWLRHTFGWSNSPRAWTERGILAGVVLTAFLLWWYSASLRFGTALTLWGAFLVGEAVALRLGRVHVFGPVLYYDMVRTARQSRHAVLRMLYAGGLLFLLFTMYMEYFGRDFETRQAAVFAETFFECLIVVQLGVVALLTPAYVAGSIAEEKERRTLEFFLATDLRNREIVLSKLGSRLATLALLLLTSLPILSFLQFLGGVDPNLVVMGFAATALTMLGIGSVSILYSVLMKKPRDAIALTYLFMIAYFALASFLLALQSSGMGFMHWPLWFGEAGPTLSDLAEFVNYGNPIAVLIQVARGGGAGSLATILPTLLANYAYFYLTLSALCLGYATVRLRSLALKESFGKTRTLRGWQLLRPRVGQLPMIWKELFIEGKLRLNWLSWGVVLLLLLLTLGTGGWIVLYTVWDIMTNAGRNGWHDVSMSMNIWIRSAGTSVACLLLLWVAVRASTSIGIERDKQTFDALITSPLTAEEMLAAKFLGSLLSVRLGMLWLGSMLLLALVTGGLHFLALPLVLGAWFTYAFCFATLGLWFSMACKTSLRATIYTVMTALAVSVGHWIVWMCCAPLMIFFSVNGGRAEGVEYLAKFQVGQTPPAVLGILLFSYEDFDHNFRRNEFGELFAFCLIGVILWGAAAALGWFAILLPRFRHFARRIELDAE